MTYHMLKTRIVRETPSCVRITACSAVHDAAQLWRLTAKKSLSNTLAGPSSIPPTTSGR
jgi:hypothetical protein